MKLLTATCSETELIPSEGPGYGVAVELLSAGDEAVAISGVFLARKGINAFPEFAEGFGFDASKVVEGLAPERYQIRVEMLASHKGRLIYGNGTSEFSLLPGKRVRFVMPVPFQAYDYFTNSPAEDLFIATENLVKESHAIEVAGLRDTLNRAIEAHGHLGSPFNMKLTLIIPQSAPPDDTMKMVGRTNPRAIRPMPNT